MTEPREDGSCVGHPRPSARVSRVTAPASAKFLQPASLTLCGCLCSPNWGKFFCDRAFWRSKGFPYADREIVLICTRGGMLGYCGVRWRGSHHLAWPAHRRGIGQSACTRPHLQQIANPPERLDGRGSCSCDDIRLPGIECGRSWKHPAHCASLKADLLRGRTARTAAYSASRSSWIGQLEEE